MVIDLLTWNLDFKTIVCMFFGWYHVVLSVIWWLIDVCEFSWKIIEYLFLELFLLDSMEKIKQVTFLQNSISI